MKKKIKPFHEISVKDLAKTIYDLHGCKATWIESAPVKEIFQGKTVWEGFVQVFDLEGHAKASRCCMRGLISWIIQKKRR